MAKVTYVSYENLKTIWAKIDELFARKKWVEEQGIAGGSVTVGLDDPDDSTPVGVYIDANTGNLWQWSE